MDPGSMMFSDSREVIVMHSEVNFLAVGAATIAGMAVGFLWFNPRLFGNTWFRTIGIDPTDRVRIAKMQKDTGPLFILMFAGVFLSAYMLARFIGLLGWGTLIGGMRLGFFVWIGFMLQVIMGFAIFGGKNRSLMWLTIFVQSGHYLAGMLVMGAILVAWR
jgi:hypothetical protein